MIIVTSRYQHRAIASSGLAPVAITVGKPKMALPYGIADDVTRLKPHPAAFGQLRRGEIDVDEYESLYRAKLDRRVRPDELRERLAGIAAGYGDARGVVLLCYCDVFGGDRCHRRVFADWWREQTDDLVPELVEDDLAVDPATGELISLGAAVR